MPVYLVVIDEYTSVEKIRQNFPSEYVEIFRNTFLISYELSDWELNDVIAELIYKDYRDYEIIIKEFKKNDLIHANDKNKYINYLFEKDELK